MRKTFAIKIPACASRAQRLPAGHGRHNVTLSTPGASTPARQHGGRRQHAADDRPRRGTRIPYRGAAGEPLAPVRSGTAPGEMNSAAGTPDHDAMLLPDQTDQTDQTGRPDLARPGPARSVTVKARPGVRRYSAFLHIEPRIDYLAAHGRTRSWPPAENPNN